jgi:uncharacterized protein (TIGR03437 family)
MVLCRFRAYAPLAALSLGIILGNTPLAGQSLPSNSTIQGSYYFRHLGVDTATSTNVAMSASGTVTFDGNGKYTMSGSRLSSATNASTALPTSGTYSVLSNGTFYMSPGVDANGDAIFGGVGNGPTLVGSSTDSAGPTLDLFVAIPVANNSASNATLSGSYYVGSMAFINGSTDASVNTYFSMTADGSGSLGNPAITGYLATSGTTAISQTSSGATYSVGTAGNGTMTFPAPSGVAAASQLLAGSKTLYVSPDGNFFIAGGASTYDFIVGVKALSGSNNTMPLSGLYFDAELGNDLTADQFGLFSWQGVNNESAGTEVVYQRYTDPAYYSYDFTTSDSLTFHGNGTVNYSDSTGTVYYQYAAGAGGNMAIGVGASGLYFLNVYAKSPALSGSGVFLNPQGIVNTASYSPFEAPIAPGEFITLFGTGLSTQTVTATSLPFPTSLGGVQVTVNGTAIPLYQVSPTAIAAIVPYTAPGDGYFDITIQVNNNGTLSNSVDWYSGFTAPGIFTLTQDGEGDGAILDAATYVPITTKSPAKVGQQVALFVSGLGIVNSTVEAGAAAPLNASATLVNALWGVYIDGVSAKINYQGLAPGLAGLYQINVTIPSGVTLGESDSILIDTGDAVTWQATIPISQ